MKNILCLILVTVLLTACGTTRENLGLKGKAPDASKAEEQKQLLLPPNYDLLPVAPIKKVQPQK